MVKCPHFRGKVTLRSIFGTQQSVLNIEVSLFQGFPFKRGSTVYYRVMIVSFLFKDYVAAF